ncbi:unnamed protein product [Rotaria sp. Silwood1]|nr:unnamed protein product [Rotaria sp. Silwood1]
MSYILGLTKPTKSELQEAHDAPMRSLYQSSIQLFPKRVDQLLFAFNKIYITSRRSSLTPDPFKRRLS